MQEEYGSDEEVAKEEEELPEGMGKKKKAKSKAKSTAKSRVVAVKPAPAPSKCRYFKVGSGQEKGTIGVRVNGYA